ncbi:hypothetical protein [Streptomyces sp. NPDC000880]
MSDKDFPLESGRQVVRLAPDELRKERLDALLTETSVREIVYVAPHGVTGEAQATKALQGVFTLAQRAAAHPPMADLVIVTDSAHCVTGQETVDPFGTALWSLGRTLRIEHPRTQVRLVELGTEGSAPASSLDAIRHVEPELARRDGLAALGSVGTAVYRSEVNTPANVPEGVAQVAGDTLAGAADVAKELPAEVAAALLGSARDAFTSGMNVIGAIGALFAVGTAILVAAVIKAPATGAGEEPSADAALAVAPENKHAL